MKTHRASRRAGFTRRATAVLALLAGATFINLILLFWGMRYRLLTGSAAAYYIGWLAQGTDSGVGVQGLALFLGLGLCLAYVICLYRAHGQGLAMGFLFYAADTVVLLITALFAVANPESCLFELMTHGAVLWILYRGAAAQQRPKRTAP